MSELKAFEVNGRALFGRFYTKEVYDKSEVDAVLAEKDKVIAELKESHKTEVKELLCLIRDKENNFNRAFDSVENELRSQKHKRCLAMEQEWRSYATFCGMQSSCHNHRGFGKTAEKWTWKECHAWKCVKRWRELAEKFKQRNNDG